jgi:autotransporter-associated beta strand protein
LNIPAITNNGTLTFDRSDTFSLAGTLSGSGTNRVLGGTTVSLDNGAAWSGGEIFILSNGLVRFNGGSGNGAASLNLDGGVVDVSGQSLPADSWANLISRMSGAKLVNSSTSPAAIDSGNNTLWLYTASLEIETVGDLQIDSVIHSTLAPTATGIIKTGAGKLTLTAANTYTGGTTVSDGTLVVSNASFTTTILPASTTAHFSTPPADGTYDVLPGPLNSASLASSSVDGLATNSTGTLTNSPNLQVIVTTASANQKPVVDGGLGFSIPENSPLATSVGTLTATDADSDPRSGWAIVSGNNGGVFALDPATGELTVAGILDHEFTSSYTLMVTVSDGTETSDSAMVSVSVVNVPEFADVFGSADPSADSNGDGISNLMAYALGASASNATVSRPVTTVNSSNLIITALVRTNDPAVQVRGSATTNLASWTNPPILGTEAADQTGAISGVTQRQEFSVERGTDPKKFLRLKATLP